MFPVMLEEYNAAGAAVVHEAQAEGTLQHLCI